MWLLQGQWPICICATHVVLAVCCRQEQLRERGAAVDELKAARREDEAAIEAERTEFSEVSLF